MPSMVLAKIMGAGDLFAAVVILLIDYIPHKITVYAALYLIIKGGFFAYVGDKVSIIDVLCGIYILIMMWGFSLSLITLLSVIFLSQKAFFSFFG